MPPARSALVDGEGAGVTLTRCQLAVASSSPCRSEFWGFAANPQVPQISRTPCEGPARTAPVRAGFWQVKSPLNFWSRDSKRRSVIRSTFRLYLDIRTPMGENRRHVAFPARNIARSPPILILPFCP